MSSRGAKAKRMFSLVRQWERSDLSLSAFAREHGVSRDTLVYWRRRADADGASIAPSTVPDVTFSPVELVTPSASAAEAALEVTFSDGTRVRIDPAAPAALVTATLAALRAKC